MSYIYFKFSGCCDGSEFQIQDSFGYSSGSTYYLETNRYSGCSELIASATTFFSGITFDSVYSAGTTAYSSCTACTTVNVCPTLPTPTPTGTPAPTSTPTPTPTIPLTPSITPTRAITPTPTRTPSVTPTKTVTPTISVTPSITKTPTNTVTPTKTVTPTNTATPSVTPTNTVTPSITPTTSIPPTPPPSSVALTSTPTPTASITPTNTPTPSPSTACTLSSICIFTNFTGYSQYDGTYFNYEILNGSTHNNKALFWSPETSAYTYYNTGTTRWCLGYILDVDCIIAGSSFSYSNCPDFDSSLFASVCPTPTPSSSGDCSTFSFDAIFDCVVSGTTPTPTPTVTPTITPTPTVTPTQVCINKAVSVSGFSFGWSLATPTPTKTSINTNRNCVVTGLTDFSFFESNFKSSSNRLLIDCSNSLNYIVSQNVPFSTGATFNAIVDGKGVCVTYNSDIFAPPTNILDSIQSGNLFECKWCLPLISSTPTQTVTPTPTITPTINVTPSNSPCANVNIDYTFIVSDGFVNNSVMNVVKKTISGGYFVAGDFTNYNTTNNSIGLIKLTNNGVPVTSFNTTSGFTALTSTYFSPNDLIEFTNGKVVCGGYFEFYSGISVNYICRLNSNGSLDTTFNIGSGFDAYVYSLGKQSDNKIIVGGLFTQYDGTSVGRICRLNVDGTIDNTFNSGGTGFNSFVYKLQILSDDSILAVGGFTTYNGSNYNRIIKLNSDGSVNATFNILAGFNGNVLNLLSSSDNSIYVSGYFTSYQGSTTPTGILKLNSNGNPDFTFNSNMGVGLSGGYLKSIVEDLDGNIIMFPESGETINNINYNGIVKFTSMGTVVNQLQSYPGFDDDVTSAVVDDNNRIVCVGLFNNYNGQPRKGVVRLYPCQVTFLTPTPTPTPTPVCPFVIQSEYVVNNPWSIMDDSYNQYVYVSSTSDNFVRIYNSNLNYITSFDAGSDDGTMIFDSDTNTMFLAQRNNDSVFVFDSVNMIPNGYISLSGGSQPYSIAYNSYFSIIATVNVGDNTVTFIDSNSYTILSTVSLLSCYNGKITFDNVNNFAYVTDTSSIDDIVYVIDPNSFSIYTTITVGSGNNVDILYNNLNTYVYVLDANSNKIFYIDTSVYEVYGEIDLQVTGVVSMTFDIYKNYIYVNTNNSTDLVIVDCSTNQKIKTIQNVSTGGSSNSPINFDKYTGNIWYGNSNSNYIQILCTDHTPILPSQTPTNTPTPSITPTNTQTPTVTPTQTSTPTPTVTPSTSVSVCYAPGSLTTIYGVNRVYTSCGGGYDAIAYTCATPTGIINIGTVSPTYASGCTFYDTLTAGTAPNVALVNRLNFKLDGSITNESQILPGIKIYASSQAPSALCSFPSARTVWINKSDITQPWLPNSGPPLIVQWTSSLDGIITSVFDCDTGMFR